MSDWIETTNKLIQDINLNERFQQTNEYWEAFQEWASKTFPEEYGND